MQKSLRLTTGDLNMYVASFLGKIHMTKVMVDVVTRSAKINHVDTKICLRNKKFEIFNVPDSNHARFTQQAQQANSY